MFANIALYCQIWFAKNINNPSKRYNF